MPADVRMTDRPTTSLDDVRDGLIRWLDAARIGETQYRFSESSGATPTLYSAVYAVLARELVQGWADVDRAALADSIKAYQDAETGYFWDPSVTFRAGGNHGSDYTRWHLTCCVLQALDALGARPDHDLSFLAPFRDPDHALEWLDERDMRTAWRESNRMRRGPTRGSTRTTWRLPGSRSPRIQRPAFGGRTLALASSTGWRPPTTS